MKTKRVLIIDDERLTRISLADFLAEEGFDTAVAGDGESAIELQRQRPFDVCIVDIRMPGIDGVEAILALHEIGPDSRFIVCTGSPQFSVPPALKRVGLSQHDVVYKPILDMSVFVQLLERTSNTHA